MNENIVAKGEIAFACLYFNPPFPTHNIIEQDDLKIVRAKISLISSNENIVTENLNNIVAKGEIDRCGHFSF